MTIYQVHNVSVAPDNFPLYLAAYGVDYNTNHVDPSVYDGPPFTMKGGKMAMNVDLDINDEGI